MHDPMVVAFDIRRPWPRRATFRRSAARPRWEIRYPWRRWFDIRPRVFMAFWTLAGREFYWPSLITIWHVEPDGRDSGTVCKRAGSWRWHVHHWRIQVVPLQHVRRHLLTRCEWCGGRDRKGDHVNVSHQWDRDSSPWWRGERGLYHNDCSSIASAHRACTCGVGPWDHELAGFAYGTCASCGKHRGWRKDPYPLEDEALALAASIPAGQRDPGKTARVKEMWVEIRSARRADALTREPEGGDAA